MKMRRFDHGSVRGDKPLPVQLCSRVPPGSQKVT